MIFAFLSASIAYFFVFAEKLNLNYSTSYNLKKFVDHTLLWAENCHALPETVSPLCTTPLVVWTIFGVIYFLFFIIGIIYLLSKNKCKFKFVVFIIPAVSGFFIFNFLYYRHEFEYKFEATTAKTNLILALTELEKQNFPKTEIAKCLKEGLDCFSVSYEKKSTGFNSMQRVVDIIRNKIK